MHFCQFHDQFWRSEHADQQLVDFLFILKMSSTSRSVPPFPTYNCCNDTYIHYGPNSAVMSDWGCSCICISSNSVHFHIKSLTFGSKNCLTTPPTVIKMAMYSPTIPTFVESKTPIIVNSAATSASLQNPRHAYSSKPGR